MEISREVLEQILQYLWQRHVHAEQTYLYYIALAPVLAVLLYLAFWTRHRAHAYTLLDALAFFFMPRGPERMLVFKDLLGNQLIFYDYRVAKGRKGYVVQAGPFLIKTREDPEAYAEPVSLIDARGPPGVPSPFGLFVRQVIAMYVMVALIGVAFSNTFWVTYSVYIKAMNVAYTSIDLAAFAALVLSIAWMIVVIWRAMAPQTLLVTLSAIGVSEGYVEASPGLDVYSGYPPPKLLAAINKEPKIVLSDEAKEVVERIEKETGDKTLAASLLALLGQVYETWRRSMGILLKDRYDISVAARARYQLQAEKIRPGFVQRNAGLLALAALFLAAILLIIWLHPSVHHVAANTSTTTYSPVSPATPPPPPSHASMPAPSPATPPPPTNATR